MMIDETSAWNLVDTLHCEFITLPVRIIRLVGLESAAFIRLAAFLSSSCREEEGWFFLEQTGAGDDDAKHLFKRLGSWQAALGISKEAQLRVRRELEKRGLLLNVPSARAQRQQQELDQDNGRAFLLVQMRGAPPRLHYKLDPKKYIEWLAV